jgi:phosphate transport system ATP-binding protein
MSDAAFVIDGVSVWYGDVPALRDVSMSIPRRGVTAFIGPSGGGKSTMLRTLNRMNDLVPAARLTGLVTFDGNDIHAPGTHVGDLRRRVGMVFQKPNPFPKSIYDNVAYGPTLHGTKGSMDDLVEQCLIRAGLWQEVKDGLDREAAALSGGQQQRLVIARCLAVSPEVLLMDEPTASLDPVASSIIEELIGDLAADLTIVLVTHDLQQAARVADSTAFFTAHVHDDGDGGRHGELVEFGPTSAIFSSPGDDRTRAFVESGSNGGRP